MSIGSCETGGGRFIGFYSYGLLTSAVWLLPLTPFGP